jgi:WD40 repeat protein
VEQGRGTAAGSRRPGRTVDFFISYAVLDEAWATWIATQLEDAGYRVMIQVWDFVPGTHFLDFIDRGIREAAAVLAVLTSNYAKSHNCRLEWLAAMRATNELPGSKLVPVRVEDGYFPDGLLASITFVDLVGLRDEAQARTRLLDMVRAWLAGRAKPGQLARYPVGPPVQLIPAGPPQAPPVPAPPVPGPPAAGPPAAGPPVPATGHLIAADPGVRQMPGGMPLPHRAAAPAAVFPPSAPARSGPRESVSVLHLAGPRFGRPDRPPEAADPVYRLGLLQRHLAGLGAQVPPPDLVLVSGDLTESGAPNQFEAAFSYVTGLGAMFGLQPDRLVVVPGSRDITRLACEAYFADCKADGREPEPPYFPKWRHYSRMFDKLYQESEDLVFDAGQPWTMFFVHDLNLAVAGLNSTIAQTHLSAGRSGELGAAQVEWFGRELAAVAESGYLRIGLVAQLPGAAGDAGFERLLAPHLNLLVHDGDPDPLRPLPAELAVLPAAAGPASAAGPAAADRVQLLHLTRDGLAVWPVPAAGAAPGRRLERRWHAAHRTFGADSDGGPVAVSAETSGLEQAATAEPEPAPTPTALLLAKIAEVCETRYQRARIRRLPGQPASLLVSYPDGDVVHQFRVAGHVGRLTAAEVAAFVGLLRATDSGSDAELVYEGPHPGAAVLEEGLRNRVRVRSLIEFQGLLDLRGYVAGQTERLRTDLVYPPELYVPQRFREMVGPDPSVREDVVGEMLQMLAAEDGRFVLLMGDFGRGKTFAMRRLALELPIRMPDVTPILIELRALDKAHSVDGLVAAHLANHGESIELRAFRYLLRQGRIVLLFDGFDELATRVSYDRAAEHLDTLLVAAEDRAKIVVASRTQHFQNDAQVRTALGERVGLLPQRRVLMLEDFSPAQVGRFLVNRYGRDEQAARERMKLIEEVHDLSGLARNPRMLTFVADLDADRLAAVARGRDLVSAAGLYQEILDAWLAHEYRRMHGVPGAPAGLSLADLWHAVRTLAMRMWESGELLLRLDDVAEVARMLTGLADTPLSPPQATHAVGTGSLLVRTEEGMFGFIHGSVMEWLVAKQIAEQLPDAARRPALLSGRPLSQLTVEFLCDLADSQALAAWTADPGEHDVAVANAIRISSRLRTPARADLRGASLRGEDLCHRELSDVDLTGADLTEARLIGTTLTRAVLRGARLVGARLDEATLRAADLSGADLSGARLAQTDLRGAQVEGARWSRAALINVVADEELWLRPELATAARAPGQPVIAGLPPAAVGVSFGFDTGRLPLPLAYNADGSLLAVGSDDGGLLLCDAATGLPVRTLTGHRARVYAVVWGPRHDALATVGADGTVRLWDPAAGRARAVLDRHPAPIWPLATDRAGRYVGFGDAEGTVRVHRFADGAPHRALPGTGARVWALAFQPGGSLLAAGDNDGSIGVWDIDGDRLAYRLDVPRTAWFTLAWSPDGCRLAAGGWDGALRVWDAATGTLLGNLPGHSGHVYTVAFDPVRDRFASGDTSGVIRLWPVPGGTGPDRPSVRLRSHDGAVYHLAYSPDGGVLASADNNGAVRIWDAGSGQERHHLRAHRGVVWPLALRPDSRQLATSGGDRTVRLWDPETGIQRHELRGHGRHVTSVRFAPVGDLLAASGNDGVVRLWDPRTGRLVRALTGTADQLVSAVFCPTSPMLATTSNDGGIHMWHLGNWQAEQELNVETEHVWASAFDPQGAVLATANDDDSVRLWMRWTGRRLLTIGDHRGRVRSIEFSPDGSQLATGCDDKQVRLFNPEDGTCTATLTGHTDRVYAVRFSPDGSMLASVSNDGTARLWDLATGDLVRVLGRHRGRLWTGAFSPDGRLFATAGDDTVIRLWDPATGQRLHTLVRHTMRISWVEFSPDGGQLASGADDGTVRLWDLADAEQPRLRLTLLGLPQGWAALTPDGRYKTEGTVAGEFWHVIGTCRFEPGELDSYLRGVHSVPVDEPF